MCRAHPLVSRACLLLLTPKTTNDLPESLPESLIQRVAIVTVKFNLPKAPLSCYILHIEGILPEHNYVPKRITSLLPTSISTSQKKILNRMGYNLRGTVDKYLLSGREG